METLGIPVLVERSSYESHPARPHGVDAAFTRALFNKEELAEEQFFKQDERF